QQQWNGYLRANTVTPLDVSRVLARVGHQNRLLRLGRRAHDAAAERNIVHRHALVVSHAEIVFQHRLGRLEQQNAETVVVDQLANELGDLAQQGLELEDR